MSRSYLLDCWFGTTYPKKKLLNFFIRWCGKDQILKIDKQRVVCEMGCSSGIAPEDTLNCLYQQLRKKGYLIEPQNIMCWSLHPDKAIYATHIEEEENGL